MLLSGSVIALPAGAGAQPRGDAARSEQVRTEARARYERGVQLFETGDQQLALLEFQRAYELLPDYRVLYNIGQIQFALGRFALARKALTAYLKEGGEAIPEARRTGVQRDLASLRLRTAFLTLKSNVDGAEFLVDDVVVGSAPLAEPLLIDAGEHVVTARHGGFVSASRRISLTGDDAAEISLGLTPVRAETVGDARGSWLWVGWGATALLTGGAATSFAVALDARGQASRLAGDLDAGSGLASANDRAKTAAAVGDVLAVSALVAGATSLYFTLKGAPRAVPVQISPSGSGVLMRAQF